MSVSTRKCWVVRTFKEVLEVLEALGTGSSLNLGNFNESGQHCRKHEVQIEP